MATGKRKADTPVSDQNKSTTKQARVSVGGKSRGPPLPNDDSPPARSRRQTQRQPAPTDSNEQDAIKKHPMVLHLEQAHSRILQETILSMERAGSPIQRSLTNSLATQSERTYESLKATQELFNDESRQFIRGNRTTAIPTTSTAVMHLMPTLKMVIDEHTEAVSRIVTELNQWTLQLLSALVETSLSAGRTLSLDSLSAAMAQQQQNPRTSAGTRAGVPLSPMSPTSPLPSSSSNEQQQRQPLFKFDRRATTIRRMLEECQRYKVCKYQDRYLGYDKATQFHSYRAEERYIQARMVVFEEEDTDSKLGMAKAE
ncbi:hypothetical protein BGZ95_003345 [Linnemannia exigua]|uniref:Uncharacterized protein n=1 Tax=Linnemannia exigua TaxID=604196 RepID=A0AAD4DI07_9FUNG|nr:hypothetical protein BGZ95_003345 [Linnemannia exigua]